LTMDHRFKAGVIADGLGDAWENAGGNDKQGLDAFYMGSPRLHTTEYNANSSVYNAARINTPTLWMQSENGADSPSNYYIFRSMQTHNIPTVRLLYGGDAHVLQRPANRLDFLRRIRTWLFTYVPQTKAQ
jgi:dipeptidyl aminopeptidase/acylaminoacyl peptidase